MKLVFINTIDFRFQAGAQKMAKKWVDFCFENHLEVFLHPRYMINIRDEENRA
jgi:hypothetical protein